MPSLVIPVMSVNLSLEFNLQAKRKSKTTSVSYLVGLTGEKRLSDIQRDPSTWDPLWGPEYIKSILEGTVTTPFILLKDSQDESIELHDGGHRDWNLARFTQGEFGVDLKFADTEPAMYWYATPKSKRPTNENNVIMNKTWRKRFDNSEVSIVEYTDLTAVEKAELFRRTNQQLSLSVGEQINAIPNSPMTAMLKKLKQKHEKVLPDGGEKKAKRNTALEKLALLALNVYSNKIDGLEHTEGGTQMLKKYLALVDKESLSPDEYPVTKLEKNITDTVAVLQSVEIAGKSRLVRDMVAVSSVLACSPIQGRVFTKDELSKFLGSTVCDSSKNKVWIGMWKGEFTIDGSRKDDSRYTHTGDIKKIRAMREAVKLWYESSVSTPTIPRYITISQPPPDLERS